MASSFRIVNYSLRPAKAAERKMLCDLFRRLEPFGGLQTYRYVGFGSIYFSDFVLFHQALGITDMVSIEKNSANKPRFEFNKPFLCVELRLGHSNSVLPQLEWSKRAIVWLDYNGKLDRSVLADISTFCSKAVSGSILLVSVNVEPQRNPALDFKDHDDFRLKSFVEAVGEENVPFGLSGSELRGKTFAKVCRKVINNTILQELSVRNGPLGKPQHLNFQQLINFRYSDDAQMLTVGGLICDAESSHFFKAGAFNELTFMRDGEDACEVRAPRLTTKEIKHLNAQLPALAKGKVVLPGVPESDVQDYAAIYRYYPAFGEVLLG